MKDRNIDRSAEPSFKSSIALICYVHLDKRTEAAAEEDITNSRLALRNPSKESDNNAASLPLGFPLKNISSCLNTITLQIRSLLLMNSFLLILIRRHAQVLL